MLKPLQGSDDPPGKKNQMDQPERERKGRSFSVFEIKLDTNFSDTDVRKKYSRGGNCKS